MCLCGGLASIQSRYDGPNQSNICSVENSVLSYSSNSVTKEKARTYPKWQIDHAKALTQKEEQGDAATTPTHWADGRMTKHTEHLRRWCDGRRRTSSTSTTSPRLTSSTKRLTDNDIVMRARSSWDVSIPILKQDHRVNEKLKDHKQMLLSASNETKAKVYLKSRYTWEEDTLDPSVQQHLEWLSFNWPQHFSSSSSSTWTGSSMWWCSQHWKEWQPAEWKDKKWWNKW